ncbi:Hypothetical predicted protein [Olea europaea subsp. europaea]|uniref:Uncharacterized protein n=1 Tax=Olea europaea subsp. europaea TaxID=158383 RepID=A0A8S0TJY1_OLEEU|nr:Hypothetical predicted protein [Olea europaea subsp. europaea]
MAFYGYNGDVGECNWTPYDTSSDYEFYNSSSYYDSSVTRAQVNYSIYDKHEPDLIQYESIQYYENEPDLISYEPIQYYDSSNGNYYDGFESRFDTNYSVYSYSEPKLVQYEPHPYARVYFSSATKSQVHNSTEEFNEIDEFDEYDPTPYGGGYDPSATYGSPLPPSDQNCYPRSTPQSEGAALDGFSYSSIPSPYGENDKQIAIKTDPQPQGESVDKIALDGVGNEKVKELPDPQPQGAIDGVGSEIGELGVNRGDELPPYYHDNGFENGQIGRQIPHGSGLECLDLCDSLFGYWPCLAKGDQKMNEICPVCGHGGRRNPWESAADYLFGTPLAYDERNDGRYQDNVYNYGGYYHVQQPQYES